MAATKSDIRAWLDRGVADGATHMLVFCDSFDHEDYPVYVQAGQNPKLVQQEHTGNMQYAMECYALHLDLDAQLKEHRAWHYEAPGVACEFPGGPAVESGDGVSYICPRCGEPRVLDDGRWVHVARDVDAPTNRDEAVDWLLRNGMTISGMLAAAARFPIDDAEHDEAEELLRKLGENDNTFAAQLRLRRDRILASWSPR